MIPNVKTRSSVIRNNKTPACSKHQQNKLEHVDTKKKTNVKNNAKLPSKNINKEVTEDTTYNKAKEVAKNLKCYVLLTPQQIDNKRQEHVNTKKEAKNKLTHNKAKKVVKNLKCVILTPQKIDHEDKGLPRRTRKESSKLQPKEEKKNDEQNVKEQEKKLQLSHEHNSMKLRIHKSDKNMKAKLKEQDLETNKQSVQREQKKKTKNVNKEEKVRFVKLKSQQSNCINHKEVVESTISKIDNIQKDCKLLPVSNLRNRRILNYAESSIDTSEEEQMEKPIQTNKVPIYQQLDANKKKNALKRHEDLYEFDESDGEKQRNRKRRKLDDSDEYNMTIKGILKNIVKKEKKKTKKKVCSDIKNNNVKKNVKIIPVANTDNIQNKPVSKSNLQVVSKENNENKFKKDATRNCQEKINSSNIVPDNYFGFDTDKVNCNVPKINIINHYQLHPNKQLDITIASPAKFGDSRPTANSTMSNNIFSPWRFNEINIKRNPHFLILKESSLPNISQEMILDHTIVDRFENTPQHSILNTPKYLTDNNVKNKKTPVQKYVTDYFGSHSENKENNANASLFDDELLSPIKGKSRYGNKVDMVKRKILGEKNDNITNKASTPRQDTLKIPQVTELENEVNTAEITEHEQENENGDNTFFGFNSDNEESYRQKTPDRHDKPFRFSVNMCGKKYARKPQKKKVKTVNNKPKPVSLVVSSDEGSEESDENETESHTGEVRLFDDVDDTPDLEIKEIKFPKKKSVLKWLSKDDQDQQKHKKRKDVRTKKEEEEAEKWAAAFNSMCEEVEEFPLEVE